MRQERFSLKRNIDNPTWLYKIGSVLLKPYYVSVLLLKPIVIKNGAWIGAGATILPGVTVGKHAIVGASSVVTKDVPDYAVLVGNPARILNYLDKERFGE